MIRLKALSIPSHFKSLGGSVPLRGQDIHHPLGSFSSLARLQATPPGQEGLVHSASPSSKGKVKGQDEQDRVSQPAFSKSLPLKGKRLRKPLGFPIPKPWALICKAPVFAS